MKQHLILLSGIVVCVALTAAGESDESPTRRLLTIQALHGVDGPFLEPGRELQGLQGDRLPWNVSGASGFLDSDGHLRLRLTGLVLADDERVPAVLRGRNDEASVRAVVACVSEDELGDPIEVRALSDAIPIDARGDAVIDTRLDLPEPCLAPVLFLMAGPGDRWFAVSGFEAGS